MARVPWTKLKAKYIISEIVSVKDFLVQEWFLKPDQDMPWWYITKTKGWKEEKKEFWNKRLEDFDLSDEQKTELAIALNKWVSAFAKMLAYYSDKMLEKIKESKKPIYVDELMKFWKFLEYYHKLKLGTEFETTVNVNIENNDPLKDLLEKLDNAE